VEIVRLLVECSDLELQMKPQPKTGAKAALTAMQLGSTHSWPTVRTVFSSTVIKHIGKQVPFRNEAFMAVYNRKAGDDKSHDSKTLLMNALWRKFDELTTHPITDEDTSYLKVSRTSPCGRVKARAT
jgi:hypothetical protein